MSSKDPDNRPTHGWSQAENLRQAEEGLKGELPKPYTVPDGYVPPTMMEQWRYAQRRCRPFGRNPFLHYRNADEANEALCCSMYGTACVHDTFVQYP